MTGPHSFRRLRAAVPAVALLLLPLPAARMAAGIPGSLPAHAQPSVAHAQPSVARGTDRPVAVQDSVSPADIREIVSYLAGDELAGRRTGTSGNSRAARYIADAFDKAGLRPVPGSIGFERSFEYAMGVDLGAHNELRLRAPGSTSGPLGLGVQFNPAGFSASGHAEGDLLFVGYGITAANLGYDDYAGLDAHGRIVLAMRYSPDGSNPHGDFGIASSLAAKVGNAREHGAAGIIFIDPPADSAALPKTELERNFGNVGLPVIFALPSLFDRMRDPSGRTLAAVQALIDSTRHPASFAPTGWGAAMSTDVSIRRGQVPNVLGLIPGNDPALRDEWIVVGAHFDHLGTGGEGSLYGGKDPAIHHGADDNASGTAGVLTLARRFAAEGGNRRSLLFVGFNGEEEGLLGSASLIEEGVIPTGNVAAMINMDMIGRLDSNRLIVEGMGTSPVWDSLVPAVNRDRFSLKLGRNGFGPSDHASFYAKDVPVLFFFTGMHRDYHRPSDTWEKLNYDGEARIVGLVGDLIHAIDARPARPPFTKVPDSVSGKANMGFRVYVGTIPDYAYEGKGLRLSGVAEGGPAQKGGLKEGDIITRVASKEVNNIYDYTYVLGELKPKQSVEIEFLRGGSPMKTTVIVGSR